MNNSFIINTYGFSRLGTIFSNTAKKFSSLPYITGFCGALLTFKIRKRKIKTRAINANKAVDIFRIQ